MTDDEKKEQANWQYYAYDQVLLDIIRRVYPNMFAHEICKVQPMRAPIGPIFGTSKAKTDD